VKEANIVWIAANSLYKQDDGNDAHAVSDIETAKK